MNEREQSWCCYCGSRANEKLKLRGVKVCIIFVGAPDAAIVMLSQCFQWNILNALTKQVVSLGFWWCRPRCCDARDYPEEYTISWYCLQKPFRECVKHVGFSCYLCRIIMSSLIVDCQLSELAASIWLDTTSLPYFWRS